MKITLYGAAASRSDRCVWTLRELELPFEVTGGREIRSTAAYRRIHPLGKLPAIVIDGRSMFESAAICTWLADSQPERQLIPEVGTWDRAMHEQWVAFSLTELEAHVWHSHRNTAVYAERDRIAEVLPQNRREFERGASALDQHLTDNDYLLGVRFSVTDIIVAFAVNWGRRQGHTGQFTQLNRWLDSLYQRPHCPLTPPD